MVKEFMKNTKNAKDFTELSIDKRARLGAKKLLTQTNDIFSLSLNQNLAL